MESDNFQSVAFTNHSLLVNYFDTVFLWFFGTRNMIFPLGKLNVMAECFDCFIISIAQMSLQQQLFPSNSFHLLWRLYRISKMILLDFPQFFSFMISLSLSDRSAEHHSGKTRVQIFLKSTWADKVPWDDIKWKMTGVENTEKKKM